MSVIFRDESNEPSSIMIGYSDATVTAPNHPLIIRSQTSLATVVYYNCGGGFVIRLHLIPQISGQPNTATEVLVTLQPMLYQLTIDLPHRPKSLHD